MPRCCGPACSLPPCCAVIHAPDTPRHLDTPTLAPRMLPPYGEASCDESCGPTAHPLHAVARPDGGSGGEVRDAHEDLARLRRRLVRVVRGDGHRRVAAIRGLQLAGLHVQRVAGVWC